MPVYCDLCAILLGGSLMKIVYRSQENRKESAQAVGVALKILFNPNECSK